MNPDYHHNSLNQHDRLHWYEIVTILGQGGFGITYLARDVNLDQNVAIKEYLPTEFSTRDASKTVQPISQNHAEIFDWGKARFLDEAKTLSSFKHPNIVRVLSFFENNNTGYMVMEYEEGQDFSDLIKAGEVFNEERLLEIIIPILDGLEQVHSQGFIHRDIKPQNIFIRTDGSPVLIDFGSARQAMGGQTRTMTSLVTPGFAPFEQYHDAEGKQGAWTDIYALGATLYSAVTGKPPKDALKRSMAQVEYQTDAYLPLVDLKAGEYSEHFLQSIDMALAFFGRNRPQSVTDWKKMLLGEMPVEIAPKAADPIAPPTVSVPPTMLATKVVAEAPADPTRVDTVAPTDPTQLNTENPVQPVTEDPADPTRLKPEPGSGVDIEFGAEPELEPVDAVTEVRIDPTRVIADDQPAAEVSAKGSMEQPVADSLAPAKIPEAKKPAEVKPTVKVPTPAPKAKPIQNVPKAGPVKIDSGEAESKKKSGWLIPLLVVVVASVAFGIYWQGRSPDAVNAPQQTTSIDEQKQIDLTQQAADKQKQIDLAKQAEAKKKQAELAKQIADKKKQAELAKQAADEQKQIDLAKQAEAKKKQAELAKQAAETQKQAELAKQAADKQKQIDLAKQAAAKKKQAEIARKAAARKKQEEADRLAAEQKKQAELALLAATRKAQEEADRQAAVAEAAKTKAFDVTGRYTADIISTGQNKNLSKLVIGRKPDITVELKQNGNKITGKIAGTRIGDLDGTIKGNKIEYNWYIFDGDGRVVPTDGKGVWTISSDGLLLEGDWRGTAYSVGGSWNLKRQ